MLHAVRLYLDLNSIKQPNRRVFSEWLSPHMYSRNLFVFDIWSGLASTLLLRRL